MRVIDRWLAFLLSKASISIRWNPLSTYKKFSFTHKICIFWKHQSKIFLSAQYKNKNLLKFADIFFSIKVCFFLYFWSTTPDILLIWWPTEKKDRRKGAKTGPPKFSLTKRNIFGPILTFSLQFPVTIWYNNNQSDAIAKILVILISAWHYHINRSLLLCDFISENNLYL